MGRGPFRLAGLEFHFGDLISAMHQAVALVAYCISHGWPEGRPLMTESIPPRKRTIRWAGERLAQVTSSAKAIREHRNASLLRLCKPARRSSGAIAC
jgi:hypothetical protein